jgi:ComF family protein
MSFPQSKLTQGTIKACSNETESFFRPDSLWMRVVDAVKEAFFPTRCLTCGSFYRVDKLFPNNLKSILQTLNCGDLKDFFSGSFFKAGKPYSDTFEYDSSAEARLFAILTAPFLCAKCANTFLTVESPLCPACGIVFKSRVGEDHLCGECLSTPKSYGMARSAGVYDKVLMDAIHCLKYNGKIQLARPLGVLLFIIFCRYWNENRPNLIIPVPLHNKKIRRRGFNPSSLLVREWAAITRALEDGHSGIPVSEDILLRTRWTKSQTGLGRKERSKNIKNAFSVNETSRINGKKILLIDDVYTTGATAKECAKVLLNAGASHVDVLTLARAM